MPLEPERERAGTGHDERCSSDRECEYGRPCGRRVHNPQEDAVVHGCCGTPPMLRDGLTGLAGAGRRPRSPAAVPGLAGGRRPAPRALRGARRPTWPTCWRCSATRSCRSTPACRRRRSGFATTVVRRGIDPGTSRTRTWSAGTSCGAPGWRPSRRGSTGPASSSALELSSVAPVRPRRLPRRAADAPRRSRARALDGRRTRAPDPARANTAQREGPGGGRGLRALGYDLDRWVLAAFLWDAHERRPAAARPARARRPSPPARPRAARR